MSSMADRPWQPLPWPMKKSFSKQRPEGQRRWRLPVGLKLEQIAAMTAMAAVVDDDGAGPAAGKQRVCARGGASYGRGHPWQGLCGV